MSIHRRHKFSFYGIGVALLLLLSCLAADTSGSKASISELPASTPLKYEIYFSPEDAVDTKLISLIESEKEDIRAAVYCLTHRGIIKALMDARKRGVNVEIIIDPFSIKAHSPLKRIAQSGISLFIWDPKPKVFSVEDTALKQRSPLMHNKFCVFGKSIVWTGSFNFTSEASQANRENVVVLHNLLVGQRYLEKFERLKDEGCATYRIYLANQSLKKKEKKSVKTKHDL